MRQPYGLLLCFILLHISNGSVSVLLVGYILYSVDLMFAICIPHILLMVYRYIYSRYSPCHDLAKWLSYYLYFFSFSFNLGLTIQKEVRESVMSQVSYGHNHMTGSHIIGMGKKCTDYVVVI